MKYKVKYCHHCFLYSRGGFDGDKGRCCHPGVEPRHRPLDGEDSLATLGWWSPDWCPLKAGKELTICFEDDDETDKE